jgi:hypothetical protein
VPFESNQLKVHVEVETNGRSSHEDPEPEVKLAIDHLAVKGTYTPAGYRTAVPSGTALHVAGSASTRIDGTVYLPTRDVDVDFGRTTLSSFRRGVVVGSIAVSGLPDDASFAPFSLPRGGSYADRLVTFAAFLDPDRSNPILTARVRFCDFQPEGGAFAPGCDGTEGQVPRVVSWQPTK